MGALRKLLIHALLIMGAAVFLLPLLWMISTALKPLEQTMSMPPTWLARRLVLEEDGHPCEVRIMETLTTRSLEVSDGSRRMLVDAAAVADGQLQFVQPDGTTRRVPVEVLRAIDASESVPWLRLYRAAASPQEWELVPASRVSGKVAPRWSNFRKAIAAMGMFPTYLKNTVTLCLLTVLGTVMSSALAAYGFARISWRGRDRVFLLALATMMVPFPVVMVPLYSLFRALGWIGTLRPLWVGSFFAGAFNVFLLRQFFMTLPKDLSEAARIDGCSEFRIFWQIILPLSRPVLMVVGLFQFMHTWNDFMGPLIYLTDQRDFTLALGLQFFQSQHGGTEWHYLMAASTLVVLPVIMLFFFAQKSFIEGISMTGVKG